MKPFADRQHAGRLLARGLAQLLGPQPGTVVLGLPRGGVPVAAEVAAGLHAPLDVLLVHKIGVPFQPELAMGALGEGELRLVDERLVASLGITPTQLAEAIGPQRLYLDWQSRRLRESRPEVPLAGATAVVVDDGFATGATAAVACRVARAKGAGRVVAAAPVGSREAVEGLRAEADDVLVLHQPRRFVAVGRWYLDFTQTSEEQVVDLLVGAGSPSPADPPMHRRVLEVVAHDVVLEARLADPPDPLGLVVLVSGSDTARHSPEHRSVAQRLGALGWSTALVDLITPADRRGYRAEDVPRLADRLVAVLRAIGGREQPALLATGIGAAACLDAAGRPGSGVSAVVSWAGRPDLVPGSAPAEVPVLLVVGRRDDALLQLNRQVLGRLGPAAELVVLPGGPDPGDPAELAAVAEHAHRWFRSHRAGTSVASPARRRC